MVNKQQIKTETTPGTSTGNPPYRLNITLNTEAKDELEALKEITKKTSLVDVLRAALTVYRVVVDHQLSGGRVIFRHTDNSEETLRFV